MARYAYIDRQYIEIFGSMPKSDLDYLDANAQAIFGVANLDTALFDPDNGIVITVSGQFDEKLTKRYATPLGVDSDGAFHLADVPLGVKSRVCDVVMFTLWIKRGMNPASAQDAEAILQRKNDALAWLNEAADSEKGFVELPRRAITPDVADVSKAGPRAYSEQSPYKWPRLQSKAAREGR